MPLRQLGRLLSLAALLVSSLEAKVLLYDGFALDPASGESRVGWSTLWGTFEGEASVGDADIAFESLESTPGLYEIGRDAVAVSQIDSLGARHLYGSFRVSAGEIIRDALIAIAFCKPDATEARPEFSPMAVIVKGWRSEFGGVVVQSKKQRGTLGVGIEPGKDYLFLFELINEGGSEDALTLWVLNDAQVTSLSRGGFRKSSLLNRSLGDGDGEVCQRIKINVTSGGQPVLEPGLVLCLINRFNAGANFDEIRISDTSFAEAAGVTQTEAPAPSIPYISQ